MPVSSGMTIASTVTHRFRRLIASEANTVTALVEWALGNE
jgi:hypothetical protein